MIGSLDSLLLQLMYFILHVCCVYCPSADLSPVSFALVPWSVDSFCHIWEHLIISFMMASYVSAATATICIAILLAPIVAFQTSSSFCSDTVRREDVPVIVRCCWCVIWTWSPVRFPIILVYFYSANQRPISKLCNPSTLFFMRYATSPKAFSRQFSVPRFLPPHYRFSCLFLTCWLEIDISVLA